MATADTVILAGARTPMGGFQGDLAGRTAPELGAAAIAAAVARAGLQPADIGETLMGCVLPAGLGQAPARQASRFAGLPDEVPCTTISKVCGSGMKAVMIGADQVVLGRAEIVVAGGMESMTNSPYLLPKARGGYRLGHGEIKDHMFLDGLEDAYEHRLMGTYAEDAARHYQFTRAEQDAYATESLMRAKRAQQAGEFAGEIVSVKDSWQGRRNRSLARRAAAQGRPREDSDTQARLRERRHGNGRQFLVDFRWRSRFGVDAQRHCGAPRTETDCADRGAGEPCRRAALVHHRAGRCNPESVEGGGLARRGCRFVRDQRGVRLRGDDRDSRFGLTA